MPELFDQAENCDFKCMKNAYNDPYDDKTCAICKKKTCSILVWWIGVFHVFTTLENLSYAEGTDKADWLD